MCLLKDFLKNQDTEIDRIVVVVSDRIQRTHADSIKEITHKYLRFPKVAPFNYIFLYNKVDNCRDDAVREENVMAMCDKLETGEYDSEIIVDGKLVTFPQSFAMGIPPGATAEEVAQALQPLVRQLFDTSGPGFQQSSARIPVSPSAKCVIS